MKNYKRSSSKGKLSSLSEKVSLVKNTVGSDWLEVISTLAPHFGNACDRVGRHVPCPIHGGKDGFRFFHDAYEKGGGICNTCGAFSDGFALLMWANGWTFVEALNEVAEHVGLDIKGGRRYERF